MAEKTFKRNSNQFGPSSDPLSDSSSKSFMGEGLTIETDLNSDETVALVESKDVAAENLKYDGVVSHISERFQRSKQNRFNDEHRWLRCYKNYRGVYDNENQFTSSEKSRAFIKITKTKALAAHAQIMDILLSGNKFPIGVEASNYPKGIASSVHIDPKEPTGPTNAPGGGGGLPSIVARKDIFDQVGPLKESLERVKDKLRDGPGLTPSSLTWEPAKDAARNMDKKIQDQLAEAGASKSLRAMVFEMAVFGAGVFKGPFARDKEYPKWGENGDYTPLVKQIPDVSFVSIWDSYPDADAANMDDAENFIQRHRMNRTQLRGLKKRPYFREESIEKAIMQGYNYTEEYWENEIKDYRTLSTTERFEVLEYWGVIDTELAKDSFDIEIPNKFKNKDQVQVNAWICNNQILRLVFNPFTPARIPYYAVPYELNPYSFFGIGIAENMEDTQLLMNGFMRMAVDNAVLSGNVILEMNETNLVPGQDMRIHPGKVFRTNGQLGQSIHSIKIDSVSQELNMLFDKARQLADEATGMPSYAHGQGGIQGIGRTASGMSMLMGAAKENIKAVVRNIDDYLLIPLGKALFAFNMQFDFDKDYVGDLEVVARGTESLMRNEVRSQKIMQFLQLTANPMDAPFAKRDYLLRELAESLDLEADKVVNDPREANIQAMQMKEMMIAQGIDPSKQGGGPGGSSANPNAVPKTNDQSAGAGSVPVPQEQGFSGTPRQPTSSAPQGK